METRFFSDVEPNMLAAGFGAAKHLSSQGYSVTLIDVSPNPGGLSAGWRTEQGRAVEAGVKGFWYQVLCGSHICIHWFWGCVLQCCSAIQPLKLPADTLIVLCTAFDDSHARLRLPDCVGLCLCLAELFWRQLHSCTVHTYASDAPQD